MGLEALPIVCLAFMAGLGFRSLGFRGLGVKGLELSSCGTGCIHAFEGVGIASHSNSIVSLHSHNDILVL